MSLALAPGYTEYFLSIVFQNHTLKVMDAQKQMLQGKLATLRHEAEEREAKRVAEEHGLPYVELDTAPVDLEAIKLIPEDEAREAQCIAISVKGNRIAVVVVDPSLPSMRAFLQKLEKQKYEVKLFVCSKRALVLAWHNYRFVIPPAKQITGRISIEERELQNYVNRLVTIEMVRAELEKYDFEKATVARFLGMVFAGAIANRTSDIHFEAEEQTARIRYRIDGVLHDILRAFSDKSYRSVISRVKLLSGLKINVRGEPQDGRFTITHAEREIEVRVSIIPAEFGETIVMRLLDPASLKSDLADLGLREDDLALVQAQLKKPNGLLLNTGPTGSGKTTTLYTFLRQVNRPEIKIITIEDPIEYRLPGVDQTQVDPAAHYTFASGLRAIVRQDPDVILVGEIRDRETAGIAMQSALTGHLVFSTLHTNNAIGAVPRLLELGVRQMVVGPALNLLIAQRLVRVLCTECKKQTTPSPEMKEKVQHFLQRLPKRVSRAPYAAPMFYEAAGCAACNHFGYKGRIGIFEFFETGGAFEELVLKKDVSEATLFDLARTQGMVTMQEDGVLKALTGMTTLEEVEGATGKIGWQRD